MAELPWIERTFQAAQKAAADAEDTSRVKIVYGGGVVVGSVHVTAQTNYDQFKAIILKSLGYDEADPKLIAFYIDGGDEIKVGCDSSTRAMLDYFGDGDVRVHQVPARGAGLGLGPRDDATRLGLT